MYLGVDPGLHRTGIAAVEGDRVLWVGVITATGKQDREASLAMCRSITFLRPSWSGSYRRVDAVAVEGQEAYVGRTPNVRDLLFLGPVSGAAIARFSDVIGTTYFPAPGEWKGQVDKPIHHARILHRLGWPFKKRKDFAYPLSGYENVEGIHNIRSTSDWKEVMDAIGLAFWAQKKHLYESEKAAALAAMDAR